MITNETIMVIALFIAISAGTTIISLNKKAANIASNSKDTKSKNVLRSLAENM